MLYTIIIVTICILLEGFFSGSEIALISSDKLKIKHRAEKGHKLSILIHKLQSTPEKLLGTTLIGTNVSTVIGSVIMASFMVSSFGEKGAVYTVIVMTPIILIFGEIIPKILYQRNADTICSIIIIPIKAASYLFHPILKVITYFANILYDSDAAKTPFVRKDELRLMVEEDKSHIDLKLSEREMISRIFNFGDITVKEVMTPLVELMAIEVNSPVEEIINKSAKEGHSRVPVFDGRIYNIIGIVNTFDLLFLSDEKKVTISDIMRSAYYIPESKRVDNLLDEMQSSGMHMAIVVDEYGGSVGLVTIEDILEEIVGEIEDEYDDEEKMYSKVDANSYKIDARMEIDAINDQLKLNLPKEDYETLGGLILEKLEKIPEQGVVLTVNNLVITVEETDGKSIKKVMVTSEFI